VLAWADFPRQHEKARCPLVDPGRRSQKIATRPPSLALPWATLLRPLRGLDVIFIEREERQGLSSQKLNISLHGDSLI
jgi:hypothetical protein